MALVLRGELAFVINIANRRIVQFCGLNGRSLHGKGFPSIDTHTGISDEAAVTCLRYSCILEQHPAVALKNLYGSGIVGCQCSFSSS